MWVDEVLFGKGFYHSDLHQGNFMLQVKEPQIILNILDFGMGGVISQEMQRKVLVLGAGVDLLKADLITRAFWDLSDKDKNTLNETRFKELVMEKIKDVRGSKDAYLSLELWTAWAMDQGLKTSL